MATGAVGFITEPHQARQIIGAGEADAVFPGCAMPRDPYRALHVAKALKVEAAYPPQYEQAKD